MGRFSLSVIVPVFNMEKYVGMCIDSLLAQTYEPLTIVLVNDCSTDNSLRILQEYKSKFKDKIILIDSKENMRQGGARNIGIRSVNSDYVGFVDADDYVHPRMFELLMSEAEKYNTDAVYCGYKMVSDTDAYLGEMEELKDVDCVYSHQDLTDDDRMELMTTHQYGNVWGGVYRHALFEELDLFFPEHLAYEDNFWVYAFQMNVKSVSFVPEALYFYRQQGESTVHKKNAQHQYDRIQIADLLYNYVVSKGYLHRYYKVIEYLFIEVFTLNTYAILLRSFDFPRSESLKQVKKGLRQRFPHWRKNPYYKKQFSVRRKLKINIFMMIPVKLCIRIIKPLVYSK